MPEFGENKKPNTGVGCLVFLASLIILALIAVSNLK